GVPSRESGDVEHHQPAMTASFREFAEPSAHYPALALAPSAVSLNSHDFLPVAKTLMSRSRVSLRRGPPCEFLAKS
ncbi:hypothetical protein, partial [Rhizobium sp. BK068]|uniref:hypothetical protein n=1 Tax=Rhizobium sp. BK068 TaxID=2512130 RepID=UPI001A9F8FC8